MNGMCVNKKWSNDDAKKIQTQIDATNWMYFNVMTFSKTVFSKTATREYKAKELFVFVESQSVCI